jgi:hypothetical protein
MPIIEKTPRACFKRFREHVAELVAATLTATRTIICAGDDQFQTLGFDQTGMIPIDTSAHGSLYFYLGQSLEAVQEKRRRFRLRTHQYWYRLQDRPGLKEKALIRWEYDYDAREEESRATPCAVSEPSLYCGRPFVGSQPTSRPDRLGDD